MSWQDIVLAIGNIFFAVALLPSILSKDKPALGTSILTTGLIYLFSFVYITLSLWFTAVTTFITGCLWLTLFIQKYLQKKNKQSGLA